MRFRLPVLALIVVTTLSCIAQAVPSGQVETLSGRKLTLPDAIRGQVSIFIVGFSRSSKDQTSEWGKNLKLLTTADRNLKVHQVVELQGAPRIFRGMIVSGIRKSVPSDRYDDFFVVTDNEDGWKQWVGFSAPDDAYVVLADKSAQQVWKTHGAFNQTLLAELRTRATALESH
jgi:hypothetical protein